MWHLQVSLQPASIDGINTVPREPDKVVVKWDGDRRPISKSGSIATRDCIQSR